MTSATAVYSLTRKVIKAGEAVGFTPAQWDALAENPHLFDAIHEVVLEKAEIILTGVINSDDAPSIPPHSRIEEHQKGGVFRWDSVRQADAVYLSPIQKKYGGKISGEDLRKELVGKPVLNACVLDYLLTHPEMIPASWRWKRTVFWGTIYRDLDPYGYLFVRSLFIDEFDKRWYSPRLKIHKFGPNPSYPNQWVHLNEFNEDTPAALRSV